MLNVNDATKNAYMNENVPKHITISFPDGDHADITNENIVEESMKLTQSICEESSPIAGGCNSSQFEITVGDIDEDLTDKKIDVTISCKDPDYKGNWTTAELYHIEDVVKSSGNYYRCICDTGFIPEMKFDAYNDAQLGGRILTLEIDGVSGCNLLKMLLANNVDWTLLTMNIEQIDTEGTIVDTLTINSNASFATYRNILRDCMWIKVTITDGSMGPASKALINSLKMYVLKVSNPVSSSDWQREYGYVDTSETEDIKLFLGTIKSAKKQQDRRFKDIIAYDCFYDLASRNIRELYAEEVGIFDVHHRGEWVSGTAYKKGDVVHYTATIPQSGFSTYDSAWYEYTNTNNLKTNWDPWSLYTGLYDGPYNISGKEHIKKLDSEKRYSVTLKNIRDKIFQVLGIEQQAVNLPFDNWEFWIKPRDEEISYAALLNYICNLNNVYGWYNPHTGQFEYITPTLNNPYDIGKNYEMDGVTFDEKMYECKEFEVANESGEIILSNALSPSMPIIYSFLVNGVYSEMNLIEMTVPTITSRLQFNPTSIKTVGLPFLTPGDCIRYKVDEYVKDSVGNFVEVEKAIDTIVMERVLSGIQALTDDIEAKYE